MPGRPNASLILKRGKERSLLRRHPWVFEGAVARVEGSPAGGALVAVRDASGAFLAWAAYAPASSIRARCWSFHESDRIDGDWIQAMVAQSLARRTALARLSSAVRLVFGESDGLPGLIVDRYDSQLVVQIQASGVDAHREALLDALVRQSGCEAVFDRSDRAMREREGLAPYGGVLRGAPPPARIAVHEHGVQYLVDVHRGHKTGFYIDQRENRARLAAMVREFARARGRPPRVLNCFCYTGGFSIAAACAGAAPVVSVDSSAEALEIADENAGRNASALPAGASALQWVCGDVFAELRGLRERGERFDFIVLDPPKFATNQHQVERAARAYKDINLNALRLLETGGQLLTFSCSGAVDAELFRKIVAGAVFDAGVDCFLRERLAAGIDHPVRMTHPEGEYLKGLALERC